MGELSRDLMLAEDLEVSHGGSKQPEFQYFRNIAHFVKAWCLSVYCVYGNLSRHRPGQFIKAGPAYMEQL